MKLARLVTPPLVLLVLVAFAALQFTRESQPAEASFGASLNLPTANCSPNANNTANVTFRWSPVVGKEQWLDISTSEHFALGSFSGHGPLEVDAASFSLQNVPANTVHYWRVNTLSESGWATSSIGAFVPCGAPVLLWGPLTCDGVARARVDFRWAPSAQGMTAQYLDLGFDPGFAPGTFTNTHAQDPSKSTYGWSGIYANVNTFFRVNALGADGNWYPSQTGAFYADCAPPVNPNIYGSADRLTIPRLGVNAMVNVRDVGFDGHLGDPEGAWDVVRYNFPVFDGFGGYPGNGGSTLIAGHVDYYYVGLAVFAPLRDILVGDQIQYQRADGVIVTYAVEWVTDLPNDYGFGEFARTSSADSLILITCNGDFNYALGEYSHRRVVKATIVR